MLGLIFIILMVGFVGFQIGTLFPRERGARGRTGSKYYVPPFYGGELLDEWQPRWSTTRRWYSNTDHKQWQKQFDALEAGVGALPGRGSTTERGHAG